MKMLAHGMIIIGNVGRGKGCALAIVAEGSEQVMRTLAWTLRKKRLRLGTWYDDATKGHDGECLNILP
jgi:hypothetical protein